jgi:hypothetical protein
MSDTINEQEKVEGTIEELPASDKPAENVQEPALPEDAKERTKEEFEKLKASNRELKEKLDAQEASKPTGSVFDELRPNSGTVPQATVPAAGTQQFVDEGGYVDATLLNSTLSGTQKAAEEARQIAMRTQDEIQRFQETQIQREVQKEFPEFDANDTDHFDPKFYQFVKNELVGQLMQGKQQDLRAAAMKARETLSPKSTVKKEETISSREQASATTGTTKSISDLDQEQEALVKGSYKGDKEAIYKRLQASGN